MRTTKCNVAAHDHKTVNAADTCKCVHDKVVLVSRWMRRRGCLVCGTHERVVLELDHRDPQTKHQSLKKSWAHGSRARVQRVVAVVLADCAVDNCAGGRAFSEAELRERYSRYDLTRSQ